MTRQELERSAHEILADIAEELRVDDWKIDLSFGPLTDAYGCVSTMTEYLHAIITIDPERHPTKATLIDTLRHECLHIATSEFGAYWDVVAKAITEDARPSMQALLYQAWERTIRQLERMWK